MKFTLKDYQNEAVVDVLAHLKKARRRWHEEAERIAFSLTAPTGAGKTVMAAAVFEALFHGDDVYEFDRDPGAVVLWFSDDPSLNEQTRFRLMEASDRLRGKTDMVVVEHPFNEARFKPGKIYFLNTQKLGKNSLLVRGFEGEGEEGTFPSMRPDLQSHTIYDTIRNTIEDPDLTLYLVLDEAHRGIGGRAGERQTIVNRLINGAGGVPGIPVVWGISATVARFNTAMAQATGRYSLPHVTVDVERVRDSGLLKDTVVLDFPDETGNFETVLLRRAVMKLRESTEEWAKYSAEQELAEPVLPLMVLQVPNTPNPAEVGRWLSTIFEHWNDLSENAVAHVFGDHKTMEFGPYKIPYLEPQRVHNDTWVRVLIAKDAINTGWDCPRAEVMLSFRTFQDDTAIAQLLGRMVRTPLARRIPGNDRLNSVDCFLPNFDRATVERVVAALCDRPDEPLPVGRVLVNPVEMGPNPSVPEAVWKKFESLPSQTRPQRGAKPVIRLTSLAHELVSDGLLPGAGGKAHAAMHAFLDQFIADRSRDFEAKRESVTTVDGRTLVVHIRSSMVADGTYTDEADEAVIDDAFRRSARILSPDVARTYTIERAKRHPLAEDDFDDALIEAREEVSALHLMENLGLLYDSEAKKLADAWFAEYEPKIRKLSDDRQEAYRQITALSSDPQNVSLVRPGNRSEMTTIRENDVERAIPTYAKHLLCDEKGLYPAELNGWERKVLDVESKRPGFQCWYRNPNRPSQDSLGIAYKEEEVWKIVRPDFLFFAEEKGKVVADLVDPHGTQLADGVPKLRGMAQYVESNPGVFRRVEAIAEVGGVLRVLDLLKSEVREEVRVATNTEALYRSAVAGNYA